MYWSGQGRQRLEWPAITNGFVWRPKVICGIQGKTGKIETFWEFRGSFPKNPHPKILLNIEKWSVTSTWKSHFRPDNKSSNAPTHTKVFYFFQVNQIILKVSDLHHSALQISTFRGLGENSTVLLIFSLKLFSIGEQREIKLWCRRILR